MVSDEQTEGCLIIIQQGLKSFGDIFMKIGISPLLDFISPTDIFDHPPPILGNFENVHSSEKLCRTFLRVLIST